MCMSRPGRVVRMRGAMAEVERGGVCAWFNALPVPDVKPGDWVLVHASIVLSVISRDDADQIEALLAGAVGGEER